MECEFRILSHLNGDYLHLKLIGRLNVVSVGQLLNLLKRYVRKVSTVIIHTNSLIRDAPSSQEEFKDALQFLREQPVRFIFTGEHASLFNSGV